MIGKNKMIRKQIDSFVSAIKKKRNTQNERGNVLFLILIAVALFAALSYAVTSSSRSGGGDANEETNLVSSASITQYPASVRTTLIRMIIGGATAEELAFNPPPYTNLDVAADDVFAAVFHPSGGGAVYSPASRDIMTTNNPDGDWFFNGNLELENVGVAGAGGNDIIAYLPGISRGVCERINLELGIVTNAAADRTPNINADLDASYRTNMLDTDSDVSTLPSNFPGTAVDVIEVATTNVFAGEPFGCFQNGGTGGGTNEEFVYYHVLIEQ